MSCFVNSYQKNILCFFIFVQLTQTSLDDGMIDPEKGRASSKSYMLAHPVIFYFRSTHSNKFGEFYSIKNPEFYEFRIYLAEKAGFEPAVPCGTQTFQACTIDHSDTSPNIWGTNIVTYKVISPQ